MATIAVSDRDIEFDLPDAAARIAAADAADLAGRHNEATILRDGMADSTTGEVFHRANGWTLRVSIRHAQAGGYLAAEVTITPPRRPGLRTSASEAQADTAAKLWLCCCAVSSESIRMDAATFLRWFLALWIPERPDWKELKRQVRNADRRIAEELLEIFEN